MIRKIYVSVFLVLPSPTHPAPSILFRYILIRSDLMRERGFSLHNTSLINIRYKVYGLRHFNFTCITITSVV